MIDPQAAAAELLSRRAARSSFHGFCERKLRGTGMTMDVHHKVLVEALDQLERGEVDRLMVMMPPGSAKSTYANVFFSEYFLGRNPTLQIITASNTKELAEEFGRRVRNAASEPDFNMLWGASLSGDNSSAARWSLDKGGQYFAVGVGGAIAGRRGDLAIIDDPVATREDADSERMRQRNWDWYNNDLLTRLKPGGRIVFIMTRWHEDDLAGRILDRDGKRWLVIKIPMEAGEKDILGRQPGERLWKSWFTEDMVQQAKCDPRSWISLYQQEPRPADGAEFKRGWICRYASPPKRGNNIILVDPAGDPQASGTQRKKSDRTVMWVVRLGPDNNAYLVDGIIDRLNTTQRIDKLFELHRKWRPHQTRYERYGMQSDVGLIRSEMDKRDYRFRLIEVGGKVDKNARIRRLIPWFEGGRIWLPHQLMYTQVDGTRIDLMREFIEVEYVTFPVGRFDDGFDCLARIEEPELTLPWPSPDEERVSGAPQWQALDAITGY